MRILRLSPVLPWPPDGGGETRIHQMLKGSSEYAETTFIAPYDASRLSDETVQQLIPRDVNARIIAVPQRFPVGRQLKGIVSLRPYHCEVYFSKEMAKAVERELHTATYDLVYCHFLYTLRYLPANIDIPIVLDQHNVDRQIWERRTRARPMPTKLIFAWNLWKTKRFENRWLKRIWAYVSVSDEDRMLTRAYAAPIVKHFFVAEQGLEVETFTPVDFRAKSEPNTITLAFLGSFGLDFNSVAAEKLMGSLFPRLRVECPDISFKLIIIGKNPTTKMIKLAEKDEAITVTGRVEDVRPWLQKADIFVAPLTFGGGAKWKVVQAMAMGLPVVGTNYAFQGLEGNDNVHFVRANEEQEFIQDIADLAHDLEKRIVLGRNARLFIEQHRDYRAINKQLIDAMRSVLPLRSER